MVNYYFTFGQIHKLKNGYLMKDHWVTVKATNYNEARNIFMQNFSEELERPLGWAFQYDEKSFKKELFSKGEYKLIKQN
jgi:hypothetical protein